jgi:hypothetical protein
MPSLMFLLLGVLVGIVITPFALYWLIGRAEDDHRPSDCWNSAVFVPLLRCVAEFCHSAPPAVPQSDW